MTHAFYFLQSLVRLKWFFTFYRVIHDHESTIWGTCLLFRGLLRSKLFQLFLRLETKNWLPMPASCLIKNNAKTLKTGPRFFRPNPKSPTPFSQGNYVNLDVTHMDFHYNTSAFHQEKCPVKLWAPWVRYGGPYYRWLKIPWVGVITPHNTGRVNWGYNIYKWSYNPCKWPFNWLTGVLAPL